MSHEKNTTAKVWADDYQAYGPVDLGTLVAWIKEERVIPRTFVKLHPEEKWRQAIDTSLLRDHFSTAPNGCAASLKPAEEAMAAELGRLPVFANLPASALEQIASLGEFYCAASQDLVVRKGDPCDAVFFVLSGTLRVRLLVGMVNPQDKTLCKISAGESFGELGMFMQGKRTADVIAETESKLFRMSISAFMLIVREIPALGSSVLFNLGVTMARRIDEDNQRFYREVTSQYLWS